MSLILLVLTALLWQRYDSEVKQYSELQRTLMQQQANQAAKDIRSQVNYFRNQMSAISLDTSWLSNLSKFQSLDTLQENMRNRLKLYFPSMHAFSIANEVGEHLGGDLEFFIGEVCQADITNLASMFTPQVPYFDYQPYIHAKEGAYHFDVMIPIFVEDQKLVFFMSFKANVLSRILKDHVISKHESFLVRKDLPDLIEVTTEHVRDALNRPFKLTEQELTQIGASALVDHTRWKVVVLENQKVMEAFKDDRRLDFAMLFSVLFVFWLTVLWLGLHHETRRSHLVSKLNHQTLHDALTGVANRRKLTQEMLFALDDARFKKQCSVLLYMDLNGFKSINDNLGHDKGDELLQQFVQRLKGLTRQHDVVARLGGDEFVVLLKGLGSCQEEVELALTEALHRFEVGLSDDYALEGVQERVICIPSIGGVIIDGKNLDIDDLLKLADKEMYRVKNEQKEIVKES